jgi:hypothetical protein
MITAIISTIIGFLFMLGMVLNDADLLEFIIYSFICLFILSTNWHPYLCILITLIPLIAALIYSAFKDKNNK